MPFLSQLVGHPADRVAVIDEEGEHTYCSLLEEARVLARVLKSHGIEGQFVAFLTGRESSFVVSLLAIWLADGIAVPLDPLMPLPEWEWRIKDLDVRYLVYSPRRHGDASYLSQRSGILMIPSTGYDSDPLPLRQVDPEQNALVLYTSGTSRCPRGVVHAFSSIEAQVRTLCAAWNWQPQDRLLHVLPLSHIHGLVCGLLCTLAAGASCKLLSSFKTEKVWEHLAEGSYTLLTAVPTIYKYLVESWSKASPENQLRWRQGAAGLRLAIVGSSSLPPSIHKDWRKISGQPLLTRYGMTEVGMVLSQQPDGERLSEYVGQPLPGVSVRLVDESGNEVDSMGEMEVRSPQMFSGYHGKEDLTQKAFRHGWYRTGDIAAFEQGQYRLLGRRSIDIIRSGGYRVSALEVEALLDAHPGVQECAVLGTPCEGLGEAVCACIVPASRHVDLDEIRQWMRTQLATYKLPTHMEILDQLPKTALGKVDKQSLKRELSLSDSSRAS
ncbi:MAG: AMP-binding protein [Endozoicomonas sp.]|uniref:AMP-binding protein n=1 Tax=Endozoicomonas sp. TaxID=1892382 RepID=UPI003D9BD14A